jgi:hypothetical protein
MPGIGSSVRLRRYCCSEYFRQYLVFLLEGLSRKTTVDEVELELRRLVNASVLHRLVDKEGDSIRYKLGGFAQQFLSHVQTPDRQFVANVRAAMKRHRADIDKSNQRFGHDKFSASLRQYLTFLARQVFATLAFRSIGA